MTIDRPDPMDFLIAGIGGPGGIDAVSRRGHAQMRSGSLPAQMFRMGDRNDQAVLEKAGVVFGEIQRSNPLFQNVTFPEGWSVKPTSHHMYSELVDEKGGKRARIMYTAQDREAWYHVNRRFTPRATQDDRDYAGEYIPTIEDCNGVQLWRGKAVRDPTPPGFDKSHGYHAYEIALAKIAELAPEWKDPSAYWGSDGDTIAWPPHETPLDTRPVYWLGIGFYNQGSYIDRGDEHMSCKTHNEEEARAKFAKEIRRLTDSYDEIRWSIRCGDRKIDSGTDYQAPRGRFLDPRDYGQDHYGRRRRR